MKDEKRRLPLVVIGLAQMLIVANISVMSISIGPIVADLETSPTNVQSALVVYSLVTAASMIAAAKAGVRYGSLRLFRAGLLVLAIALAGIALTHGPAMLIGAEAIAGAATAALAPAIVALIAANYEGSERAFAIGVITAAGGSLAMLLAGLLGSAVGWRPPFWILAAIAALVLGISRRLEHPQHDSSVVIDWVGVLASAAAIVLLTLGVNGIASWGLMTAKDTAPVEVFGLSPSLILIITGISLGWAFFAHQRRRAAAGRTPLLSPQVVESAASRLGLVAVAVTLAVYAGISFLLPLYIQVVQGYGSLATATRIAPYALSLSAAAVLSTRLLGRVTTRRITRTSLLLLAVGLLAVGAAIQNHWSNAAVLLGLILAGLGTGAALTVLGNALVGSSAPALATEVGAARNTASNLGSAIGTAIAGTLLIVLLAGQIKHTTPPELRERVKLDHVQFISNQQLQRAAAHAGLSKSEVDEAVRINTNARLTALRLSFFALAGLSALAAITASALPDARQASYTAARTRRRRT